MFILSTPKIHQFHFSLQIPRIPLVRIASEREFPSRLFLETIEQAEFAEGWICRGFQHKGAGVLVCVEF